MASIESQLQRLVLTAQEVKEQTGWRWEMVEDYVNILRDLILLAQSIDDNISNLESSLQQNADNQSAISLVRSRLNSLKSYIDDSAFKSFSITSNHTTSGNEILNFENVIDVDITLNLTPKDQETIHFTYNGAFPSKAVFVGPINNDTEAVVFVPGTGGTIYYSSDLSQWRFR